MTRYYYTDPLAAMWMSKHFGMKYFHFGYKGIKEATYDIEDWYEIIESIYYNQYEITRPFGNYYIHPDSETVLMPKLGDKIESLEKFTVGNVFRVIDDTPFDGRSINITFAIECVNIGDCKIIQRNGIPFMWPEIEE